MERLTRRTSYGAAYMLITLNESRIIDENENAVPCLTGKVADRLAAYEDTDYQPEDIPKLVAVCNSMQDENLELRSEVTAYRALGTPDEISAQLERLKAYDEAEASREKQAYKRFVEGINSILNPEHAAKILSRSEADASIGGGECTN